MPVSIEKLNELHKRTLELLWYELVDEVNYHNQQYYSGQAEISNYEFDILYKELEDLEIDYKKLYLCQQN